MRILFAWPLVLVAATALAGCHGPMPGDAPDAAAMRLSGWFADYNDTIAADFDATVTPYSDDVLMMESFPPGFEVRGLDADTCRDLRMELLDKAYLDSVGDCRPQAETVDGDEATSNDA